MSMDVIRAMKRLSFEHCQILLSPSYRDIGAGVDPRPVPGVADVPGTWTVDVALRQAFAEVFGAWSARLPEATA